MSLAGVKRVIGHASVNLDLNVRVVRPTLSPHSVNSAVNGYVQHKCWFGECGIGSWTADQFLAAGQTDMAFINGGALAYIPLIPSAPDRHFLCYSAVCGVVS